LWTAATPVTGSADGDADTARALITISVLGALRVHWHPEAEKEREITGALQPRTQELLVLLALHPGGTTRDTLVSVLWGQDPPARPTNALHTALSRMRHDLGEATGGAVTDIALVDNGHYRLDPAVVHVDYWRFENAMIARRAATTDAERIAAYRQVVDSYGGELLPGHYEEWIEPERQRLAEVLEPWMAGPIEHVGSTAIPGLTAKPIIDIMVAVRTLEESQPAIDLLRGLSYLYFPHRADVMHWFCKPSSAFRTHHLHLVPLGSKRWVECLGFRDAVRSDRALVAEYAALKHRLAEQFKFDREAYTDGKAPFVERVLLHIPHDSDDFVPRLLRSETDSLAKRGARIAPQLPREVLRNNDDRSLVVDLRPGEITAGNQRIAHRTEEIRTDGFEPANGRNFALGVGPVFGEDGIVGICAIGRNAASEGGG